MLWLGGAALAQTAVNEVRVEKNIPYRAGNALTPYAQERCTLDLYLPAATPNAPVLVWFHGGGLEWGSKGDAAPVATFLAQRGIAVAAANYQLAPKVAYPAFNDDAAAAVGWVKRHVADYGLASRGLYIAGHSAGGYLAAYVGLSADLLAKYDVKLTEIAGVIPISGQMFTHIAIRTARGIRNPRATPVLDEAAPCYHVRKDAPPFLVLCADDDMPLRTDENRFFVAALKYAGHTRVEYLEIAKRNHTSIVQKMPEANDPAAAAVLAFIAKYAPKE